MERVRIVLGIDPGRTGGIVLLGLDDDREAVIPMPESDDLLPDVFKPLVTRFTIVGCALEKAQPMPRDGAVSAFNYGKHAGYIEATLHIYGIPIYNVTPRQWQKTVTGLIPGTAPKKPDMSAMNAKERKAAEKAHTAALASRRRDIKNNSRRLARERHPQSAHYFKRVKDDGLADAMHLCEYLRQKVRGDQSG